MQSHNGSFSKNFYNAVSVMVIWEISSHDCFFSPKAIETVLKKIERFRILKDAVTIQFKYGKIIFLNAY